MASASGGLRQPSLQHSGLQGVPDSLDREPFMMRIETGAHLCRVCCNAGSAAGAGARIAVWLASEMRLGHIDQVALAVKRPGVVCTHDVVVLQPALCTPSFVSSPYICYQEEALAAVTVQKWTSPRMRAIPRVPLCPGYVENASELRHHWACRLLRDAGMAPAKASGASGLAGVRPERGASRWEHWSSMQTHCPASSLHTTSSLPSRLMALGFLVSRASMMDTAMHDSVALVQHLCAGSLGQPRYAICGCLVVHRTRLGSSSDAGATQRFWNKRTEADFTCIPLLRPYEWLLHCNDQF